MRAHRARAGVMKKAAYAARFLAAGLFVGALLAGFATRTIALAAHHEPARVAMVIVPGVHLGPDHKMHDSYTPTDFTAPAGEKIIVTVYNYDTGRHSFMAPSLHLNVLIPAAQRTGVPAVKVFSFTVPRAGIYRWHCMQPCDDEAGGWAMAHQGYMAGTITIEPR
jgi:heme/copper-type cytochrome/quinol oxidase subunit 2